MKTVLCVLFLIAGPCAGQGHVPDVDKPPCMLAPKNWVAQSAVCADRAGCTRPLPVPYGKPDTPHGFIVIPEGVMITLEEADGRRRVCMLRQEVYPFVQEINGRIVARTLGNGQFIETPLGQPFFLVLTGVAWN